MAVPAGARRIDARGKVVTPGLIDSLTRSASSRSTRSRAPTTPATEDDRITAAFNVADALNPRSILIPVNRIEGLTRAVVAPQHRQAA